MTRQHATDDIQIHEIQCTQMWLATLWNANIFVSINAKTAELFFHMHNNDGSRYIFKHKLYEPAASVLRIIFQTKSVNLW